MSFLIAIRNIYGVLEMQEMDEANVAPPNENTLLLHLQLRYFRIWS